jgi:chromosome segregation ATPase
MRKKGIAALLVVIVVCIAGVGIGGAIWWFSRPSGSVEALSIKNTLNEMANKVEANEKAIKAAEQLVVELKNEQIVYVEKLAEANLKEKAVKEDFKKALEDYNLSAKKANRLQEELSTYAGESDLNKVVEIGGVNASLREHQINLSNINTQTSLKSQTADLKRQYYESTKQLVENSRATIDKLKFDIMEWENKVVQFRIILQNNEMQRAFLADQAEMYAGSKTKLESLMATAKSIEEAFLKQQEVDKLISEINSAKPNYEWGDIPEPSTVQIQIPEGGWKEIQYEF